MTTWVEGQRSFFLGAQAFLVDNDREMAANWAAPHILHNPAYKYVLGRFVEADRPNQNRQLFSLEGLQINRPTITHAPMNMNHSVRRVVGAYIAAELLYPTDIAASITDYRGSSPVCAVCGTPWVLKKETAFCPQCEKEDPEVSVELVAELMTDAGLNPYIEALGVFWRHYFPEEYALVEEAHQEGRLYYSMECIPDEMQCVGDGGCGSTFEYAGRTSPTYCDHLNKSTSDKFLIGPHFTAGALLVGVNPGWKRADVHSLVSGHAQLAERIYEGIATDLPHLNPAQWEATMAEILVLASH